MSKLICDDCGFFFEEQGKNSCIISHLDYLKQKDNDNLKCKNFIEKIKDNKDKSFEYKFKISNRFRMTNFKLCGLCKFYSKNKKCKIMNIKTNLLNTCDEFEEYKNIFY